MVQKALSNRQIDTQIEKHGRQLRLFPGLYDKGCKPEEWQGKKCSKM